MSTGLARVLLLTVVVNVSACTAQQPTGDAVAGAAAAPAPATQPGAGDDASAALAWPRRFEEAGNAFAVYQPQVETWQGNRLDARAAVAVTPAGQKEPTFGVVRLSARTHVDKSSRMAELDDIELQSVTFPQSPARQAEYLDMIRKHAEVSRDVPLDHLEANLAATAAERQTRRAVEVKNEPPKIIFTTAPSLLVLIDGEPVLREVQGTGVMRVINTRALILLDPGGRYNLRAVNGWFTAPKVSGPWHRGSVPPTFDGIAKTLAQQNAVDLLDPAVPEAAPKEVPAIYVSTTPAELIQTRGEPEYTPVDGTGILYVKNTDSALFKHTPSNTFYVLVSGRWFSSAALNGPWAFVPGAALPAEFAKIPPESPKANVLVSVPGTPQAREAVIANSIPQTATVRLDETKLTVTYDGTPRFKRVEGAQGLSYATNSPLPVIEVEADKTYWCVENGVWFTAHSPTGPWVVATAVPRIIYTIPVSSPIHYVTYVHVYGTGPGVVYVGYTPGYMGTCVTNAGVVVYGTGYYYPAYVGTVWYGYPPTYGYGAGFACGTMTGFAFGFAAGAMMGDCWTRPYWGPCWGYAHVDLNTANVYTNWRGGVTSVNRHYEWDGDRVRSSGYARSFNPYTGRASVGGYSSHYNYENNEFGVKRGGATYNPRSGRGAGGGAKLTGDVDERTRTLTRGGATYDRSTGVIEGGGAKTHVDFDHGHVDRETGHFRYDTRTDTGIARKGDEVYAGHGDNVYRHTDGGWQRHTDDGWRDADRGGGGNFVRERGALESQRASRQTGQHRFQSSRSFGGYHARGGGGVRGGRR